MASSSEKAVAQDDQDDPRPTHSLFSGDPVSAVFDTGEILILPKALLSKSPKLTSLITVSTNGPYGHQCHCPITSIVRTSRLVLPNMLASVGHVLFTYLLTEKYDALRPKGWSPETRNESEFITAVRVADAAYEYDMYGLVRLAEEEIRRCGDRLEFSRFMKLMYCVSSTVQGLPGVSDYVDSRVSDGCGGVDPSPVDDLLSTLDRPYTAFAVILDSLLRLHKKTLATEQQRSQAETPGIPDEEVEEAQVEQGLEEDTEGEQSSDEEEEVQEEPPVEPELEPLPELELDVSALIFPEPNAAESSEPPHPPEAPVDTRFSFPPTIDETPAPKKTRGWRPWEKPADFDKPRLSVATQKANREARRVASARKLVEDADRRSMEQRDRIRVEQQVRDAEEFSKLAAEKVEKAVQRELARRRAARGDAEASNRAQGAELARSASPAFEDVFPSAPTSEGGSSSLGWHECPVEEEDSEEYDNVTVSSIE